MDPFSALSLASNIVQFVDFGYKLTSNSLEIYKSAKGASSANEELEFITKDLNEICIGLGKPVDRTYGLLASDSEKALLPLTQSCRDLAKKFLDALEDLRVKGGRRKWESVRQALRSAWKDKDLKQFQKRLDNYQSQIAFHLTSILRYV